MEAGVLYHQMAPSHGQFVENAWFVPEWAQSAQRQIVRALSEVQTVETSSTGLWVNAHDAGDQGFADLALLFHPFPRFLRVQLELSLVFLFAQDTLRLDQFLGSEFEATASRWSRWFGRVMDSYGLRVGGLRTF